MADVYIHVTDKNDNAPIFKAETRHYYFKNIKEKVLLNFTATDPDENLGGVVKYRMNSTRRVSGTIIVN